MLTSIDPRTGRPGDTQFHEATIVDVAAAVDAAEAAFAMWKDAPAAQRASVLRAMADALAAGREAIVRAADFETGLGGPRLSGELDRTTGQLRAFAADVEDGRFLDVIITTADPNARPLPRPDIRRAALPMGPVAVFTPSNFPLAFGVAGGDTASALAAGCPVVVKGHPSHPATSDLCARAMTTAASTAGAPPGLFTVLQAREPDISRALVLAPAVAAVAFTGSQHVGRLLHDLAASRPRPVPFYGELGSLNPLFVGPAALAARADEIATGLAASMTLGSGQFCTKPGVVFVPLGADGDAFVKKLTERLMAVPGSVLLNEGVRASFAHRLGHVRATPGVHEATPSRALPADAIHVFPVLFVTDPETFRAEPAVREELFGPAGVIVRCRPEEMSDTAAVLGGQLTATLHADRADDEWAAAHLSELAHQAGRIVWNGYPTGVAVVPAMHHGGPYPASTSALHTSVGATAIRRFVRPVAYQNVPDHLLPPALQNANPLKLPRMVDGVLTSAGISPPPRG